MKLIKSLIFTTLIAGSFAVQAQAINDRWIGSWKSGQEKLVITPAAVAGCRWVGAKPKSAFKGCVSYYDGSVNKKDLVASIQSDTSMINEWLKQKQITSKEFQAFKNEIQTYAAIVDQLPNEGFKKVNVDQGEMSNPDGGGFYFLNENTIYSASYSQGGMGPSFSLAKYVKQQ
jgi:hypothetical protein